MLILQSSVSADPLSLHETRQGALEALASLIRDGLAEPEEFEAREIDADGITVPIVGLQEGVQTSARSA